MFRYIKYSFLFLFFVSATTAQVTFTTETDAKEVAVGDYIDLKFTLKNAQGSNFRSPVLSDFLIVGGPNRMNSMTIINGQAASSESYGFTLQAKKEGTFTIGSAHITAKGQNFSSEPITIVVKKGNQQTAADVKGAKGDVFLRADASVNKAYIGQQIIVDYKLYAAVNVNGINLVAEPAYDGFYKEEISNFQRTDQRVTVGGKVYITRILKRVAIFPQREGTQTIEPIEFRLNLPSKQNRDDINDPFGLFSNSIPTSIACNALQFDVKNLPSPVPNNFSGIAGEKPTVELFPIKNTATTDDVIELKLNVTGTGDPKRIQAPTMESTSKYSVSEPKTIKEDHIEQQGAFTTTKSFEYFITPKDTGILTPELHLSYFDVKEEKYKNIDLPSQTINVTQGKNTTTKTIADSIPENQTVTNSWLTPILIGLAFFLLAGAVYFYVNSRGKKQNTEEKIQIVKPEVPSKQFTGANTIKQLTGIEPLYAENPHRYYEEISKTLFKYVQDRFEIPLSDFSKTVLQNTLRYKKISENNIQALTNVINVCERALFAGLKTESSDSPKLTQVAVNAVQAIEKELN